MTTVWQDTSISGNIFALGSILLLSLSNSTGICIIKPACVERERDWYFIILNPINATIWIDTVSPNDLKGYISRWYVKTCIGSNGWSDKKKSDEGQNYMKRIVLLKKQATLLPPVSHVVICYFPQISEMIYIGKKPPFCCDNGRFLRGGGALCCCGIPQFPSSPSPRETCSTVEIVKIHFWLMPWSCKVNQAGTPIDLNISPCGPTLMSVQSPIQVSGDLCRHRRVIIRYQIAGSCAKTLRMKDSSLTHST